MFDGMVDHINKFELFHRLAASAKEVIDAQRYEEMDVYRAVIDEAKRIQSDWKDDISRYYQSQHQLIASTEAFVKSHHGSSGDPLTRLE